MEAEEWRTVPGYPDYSISSWGRVFSRSPRKRGRKPRLLRPSAHQDGYPQVTLCRPGGPKRTRLVHHLVAEGFIGARPDGMDIRHLDGDPANCRVGNLAYGTRSENCYDRVQHGRDWQSEKTHCKFNHPYDEANTYLRPRGGRDCRTCRYNRSRERRSRQALAAANVSTIARSAA